MGDERISQLHEAALKMQDGQYMVELPIDASDEIGSLGVALLDLGHTLESRFREMRALTRVTEQVNAGLLLDDVLEHVYESFRSILPYDRIGFALLEEDEKGGTLVRAHWARTDFDEPLLRVGFAAPLAGSSLETIIQTGKPRIINDLEAYLREHPRSKATRLVVAEGVRSSLTCPLIVLGKPVGFMFFSSRYPETYRDVHVDVFLEIAGQLSTIVEKSRIYQEVLELSELKSKFLGIAAHDLRGPLGIIRGWCSLLAEDVAGQSLEERRSILDRVDRTCGHMLSLIDDLLDVSVIESGHLELERRQVRIPDFIRECEESYGILTRNKGIAFEVELEQGLPELLIDPARVQQVLSNLLDNAIKFSHPGTAITLRVRRADQMIELAVCDQGEGIAEDELGVVFEEFGRASNRPTAGENSTGLGLAIVKRIVQAHGGAVGVESEVGEGSVFTVRLPIAAPE